MFHGGAVCGRVKHGRKDGVGGISEQSSKVGLRPIGRRLSMGRRETGRTLAHHGKLDKIQSVYGTEIPMPPYKERRDCYRQLEAFMECGKEY